MADQKIELTDLLRHVLQQRRRDKGLYLIDPGSNSAGAWCRLVVDDLTDDIRDTIARMREVVHCVLGLDLSVIVYTRHDVIASADGEPP